MMKESDYNTTQINNHKRGSSFGGTIYHKKQRSAKDKVLNLASEKVKV